MPRTNARINNFGKITPNQLHRFSGISRALIIKLVASGKLTSIQPPGTKDIHISARSAVELLKKSGIPVPEALQIISDNYDKYFTEDFQQKTNEV